jgi:hypothetical protein
VTVHPTRTAASAAGASKCAVFWPINAFAAVVGMNRPTDGASPNSKPLTTKSQASRTITAATWLRRMAPSPTPGSRDDDPPSGTALASSARRPVPACARALAARLSALFESDVRIVGRLNDTQRRLACANDRLWCGLAPDGLGLIYDGGAPAGISQIASLIQDAASASGPGFQTMLLGALQEAHWAIHRAFCEYQSACEQRRQLAVEVGELAQQLTDALCAVGWSEQQARDADVHQLADVAGQTTSDGERER